MKSALLSVMFGILVLCAGCQPKENQMNTKTTTEFDLNRYLGTWYEIARFDHRFERGLQNVTATYSLRNDGKIKVVNRGINENGESSEAIGKAKTTSETGKLKVSFFWIFYADYFILELDENYGWALIGSQSDKYLWILSRTPVLDESVKTGILEMAKNRGYDTSKLIWVKQD